MAQHSPKLPVSFMRGEPKLKITDADWLRIERAYRKKLPGKRSADDMRSAEDPADDLRDEIYKASLEFLRFDAAERAAERVADAVAMVEACRARASDVLAALDVMHGSSVASIYAETLVEKNFLSPYDRPLETLYALLSSLHSASVAALAELEQERNGGSFRRGEAWQEWIVRLTEILKTRGLPTGVSKDGLKNSPFVALVRELQECFPAECRRSMHSDAALAAAVTRARQAPRALASESG